jgi:aryl-alcohol dehydrogenase-like predicted oxidoreductase
MDRRGFMRRLAMAVAVGATSRQPSSAGDSAGQREPNGPALPRRVLGRTGVEVTAVILGGVAAMKQAPTASFHPAQLAEAALDAGINYFDTAAAYGSGQSERNYGEVLATRRNEVFLATKTGNRSYDGAMREVEESLKRLRTDRLDLLQVHGVRADEDCTTWDRSDGVMKALHKLRDEKVTRFIGVTGHESPESVRRAIDLFDFDTVLTTFNPTARRVPYQRVVLPVARRKNMGILAMKVMGGGLGSLAVGNPIKNDTDQYWYHDDAPRQAEAGVLIRYALGLPISAAIVGMHSVEQLSTNVAAVRNERPLRTQERQALETRMS